MECTTTTAMKTTAKNTKNTKNRNWKWTRPLVAFSALLVFGLFGVSPAVAASPDHAQSGRLPIAETSPVSKSAADSTGTRSRPAPSTDDTNRYAAREKTAGQQENFRGGSASIYIGGSALTIALVIILLIIIL